MKGIQIPGGKEYEFVGYADIKRIKSQKQKLQSSVKQNKCLNVSTPVSSADNKLIWTAEEIMNQSNYMDNRNKQFLDADEVKRIIEEMDLCCTKHTYGVDTPCRVMNERLMKRLKLK